MTKARFVIGAAGVETVTESASSSGAVSSGNEV